MSRTDASVPPHAMVVTLPFPEGLEADERLTSAMSCPWKLDPMLLQNPLLGVRKNPQLNPTLPLLAAAVEEDDEEEQHATQVEICVAAVKLTAAMPRKISRSIIGIAGLGLAKSSHLRSLLPTNSSSQIVAIPLAANSSDSTDSSSSRDSQTHAIRVKLIPLAQSQSA